MVIAVMKVKARMINVRLSEEAHEDFKIACELRGVSMSSLIHQFVVRVIREEKEREPKAFIRQNTVRESARKPVSVESDGILDARTKTRTSTPKPNVSKRKKA